MRNHTNLAVWLINAILSTLNISSYVFASSGTQAFSTGQCDSYTMSMLICAINLKINHLILSKKLVHFAMQIRKLVL